MPKKAVQISDGFKKPNRKMTQEQLDRKMSETSNEDLAKIAQEELSKLCKTGGRSLIMSIPPRYNDTDMIFAELINRFKTITNQF